MVLLLAILGARTSAAQAIPALPDTTDWDVHVLAIARAPDSSLWVGTYGKGIFVLRHGAGRQAPPAWEQLRHSDDTAAHSVSWDFVHAFAFGPRGEIWYGTVGNGWGLSTDGGKTWKNWEYAQLGPEWQYVAPDGIVTGGDTTWVATADGIKLTWDDGATWRVITDSAGAATAADSVWGRIANQYVQAIRRTDDGRLLVRHLHGVAVSRDGGRTWLEQPAPPGCRTCIEAADARAPVPVAGPVPSNRPVPTTTDNAVAQPTAPRHTWFRRPIALEDQPYIDQTYRFGSTMGGSFQAHQGVEFNNPDGTRVHAIGDGTVVWAGPAEAGALTVAIRHERRLSANGVPLTLFSVYYHNTALLVKVGDRVKAGGVVALAGNTGRATNDHLHLEVHAAPTDSVRAIVDPAVRYPPHNANPELWIAPLPGTGLVAGQVWDSSGQPVLGARIYGLAKPEPRETPFSFIEAYGPRNHPDPVYGEHFAISDVPPGEYVLGVRIAGRPVYRRIRVAAGKVTWVEFRPAVPK